MKFLGIDYGAKRVGIAVSDEAGRVAFPKNVFTNDSGLVGRIKAMCEENKIAKVVIGESLNYKREPNAIDVAAKKFVEQLVALGLPIEWENEWLTSAAAERSGGDDSSAAALILQTYIDKHA